MLHCSLSSSRVTEVSCCECCHADGDPGAPKEGKKKKTGGAERAQKNENHRGRGLFICAGVFMLFLFLMKARRSRLTLSTRINRFWPAEGRRGGGGRTLPADSRRAIDQFGTRGRSNRTVTEEGGVLASAGVVVGYRSLDTDGVMEVRGHGGFSGGLEERNWSYTTFRRRPRTRPQRASKKKGKRAAG